MTKQMAFYFDASACNGCKACVVACKSKNNLPVGINWRRVTEYGGGSWIPDPEDPDADAAQQYLCLRDLDFVQSLRKARSAWKSARPARSARAMTGLCPIDQSKCIGCRYCEWACPYGAPQFDASGWCDDQVQFL